MSESHESHESSSGQGHTGYAFQRESAERPVFLFEKVWLVCIDECLRFRLAGRLNSKTPADILHGYIQTWARLFGPMETLVIDQEGGMTSDMASLFCDRYNIKREFGGTAAHTHTGLAERAISHQGGGTEDQGGLSQAGHHQRYRRGHCF